MKNLHSLIIASHKPTYFWVRDGIPHHSAMGGCTIIGASNHHACARVFLKPITTRYSIYFCECFTCYQEFGLDIRHYFLATNDRVTCQSCLENKHPNFGT